MKKTAVLTVLLIVASALSVAIAGDKGEGKVGNLFLFQKCDPSLVPAADAENPKYGPDGCPLPGNGPWPIVLDNSRWGQMNYNLLGDKFRFSFECKRAVPETDYVLIYYPDEWPGNGLVCLGRETSNPAGNLQIHGEAEFPSGLPALYDKNYNPAAPSGATGAKIWLVPAADVKCEGTGDVLPETGLQADPPQMTGWNPSSYLFEGNPIVYQYFSEADADADADAESTAALENHPKDKDEEPAAETEAAPEDDGKKDKDKGKK